MAVRNWNNLSPAYRNRLQRAGITRSIYESGASLQKARGHAETPERPERAAKQPTKYRKYLNIRNQLVQQVIDRKNALFGGRPKFDHVNSASYVIKGVPNLPGFEQKPPTITELRKALAKSDDEILREARAQTPDKSYWWYH